MKDKPLNDQTADKIARWLLQTAADAFTDEDVIREFEDWKKTIAERKSHGKRNR